MIQPELGQVGCDGVWMHFLLELELDGSARERNERHEFPDVDVLGVVVLYEFHYFPYIGVRYDFVSGGHPFHDSYCLDGYSGRPYLFFPDHLEQDLRQVISMFFEVKPDG